MVCASDIATEMGILKKRDRDRIENLIARAGLPVRIKPAVGIGRMIPCLYLDKKLRAGRLNFVLPLEIGRACVRDDVPVDTIKKVLAKRFKTRSK